MKTTATFKLSKRNKTLLALLPFKNEEQRHSFRRMMIEAQVIGNTVVKSPKERNTIKGE
jgi:hypothetical protein